MYLLSQRHGAEEADDDDLGGDEQHVEWARAAPSTLLPGGAPAPPHAGKQGGAPHGGAGAGEG